MTALSDLDVKATQPTAVVKLAAATQAMVGLLTILCGVQIAELEFYRYPFLAALPYLMMGGGLLQIVLGSQVYRIRTWAAFGGVALGGFMALVLLGWAIYSFGNAFSCLLYVNIPFAGLTVLLAGAAIPAVRKAAAARARLAAEGLSLGV